MPSTHYYDGFTTEIGFSKSSDVELGFVYPGGCTNRQLKMSFLCILITQQMEVNISCTGRGPDAGRYMYTKCSLLAHLQNTPFLTDS